MAQVPKVMDTMPADRAVLTNASGEFYVRFDRPVDHIRSLMFIKRDGAVVRTLHPRFKTEPNVLFAMALPLQPGPYSFHWSVRSLAGAEVLEGEVPFSVSAEQ
ncbi:copper resistance protein CopC [Reyranella sp.]|uniref:copper resistance protein CopC n=1 Tax=Reyranella sp. TaxID=1929291 RepID=UPI003D09FA1E